MNSAFAGRIRPVILGGDIGSYATARAFHEAYGVNSVIIAGTRVGAVADSSIVDLRIVPDLENRFVAEIAAIMEEDPGSTHILLGSVDWWVEGLLAHREELGAAVIPYADEGLIERVGDKAEFARLCQALDIPHPRTLIVRPGDPIPADLPQPMVVKVANPGAFRDVDFVGKQKVEFFDSPAQLQEYLSRVADAGYEGEFVVQEFIEGGDDAMAAVNAFYGPDGSAHFFVYGRVLLEEHTPNGLGNSVAQITGSGPDHPAILAAEKLLDHLGWVGFANLDLKITGEEYVFLELNPRIGRSGYAVTAAGFNTARYYVDAFVGGVAPPQRRVVGDEEHLFTVVPTSLLTKYAPAWVKQIAALKRRGAVTNPYYYRHERNPKRWFYIAAAMMNQFRKFARFHPAAHGSGATKRDA